AAWAGVRPPLRELQWKQALTTFSHRSRPPWDSGTTWSRVSCWRGNWLPQYRHRCWSRANSAGLLSAGVGLMALARACPRAAMIGCTCSTLWRPVLRLMPPCTVRQGSPRVQVTASRAYRQAASCQLIQSRTRPWASRESRRTLSSLGWEDTAWPWGDRSPAAAVPGAGGDAPARSRRSFALSSFIGLTAYTRIVTRWGRARGCAGVADVPSARDGQSKSPASSD